MAGEWKMKCRKARCRNGGRNCEHLDSVSGAGLHVKPQFDLQGRKGGAGT